MHLRIALHAALLLSFFSPHVLHAQDEEPQSSFEAVVTEAADVPCSDGGTGCSRLTLTGASGDFEGEPIVIETDPDDDLGGMRTSYRPGDRVILQTQEIQGERFYFISDQVRRTPLLWLALLFAAAVFAFGGWRSLRSFLGLIASFAVLLAFILPRILAGDPPLVIALLGSFVIMVLTFLLSHGLNRKTAAALAGTAGSLVLTGLLAAGFSVYARLTGTADEEMLFLLQDYPGLDTSGILLAGIIIGSLGVLDDITISQASAVFELRRANALLSARELYRRAVRIGADHIAAAVNTLVLAYAGASLPLLLLLLASPAGEPWWIFLNREMIATEIVRTLTGSIGLLAAVPLTTLIASLLAVRTPASALSGEENAHGHTH